jgi:2-dehydropantoate 2-reductase
MKIGIVGAGAIGGWIGIPLAALGHEVSVLARGETLHVLRRGGWRLERPSEGTSTHAMVHASDAAADLGEQDVLVIAVKGHALAALAPSLAPMIDSQTLIVPAMNGVPWWFLLTDETPDVGMPLASVDPGGAIAHAMPLDQVIGCVVHGSARSDGPGVVVHTAGKRLIIGEPAGGRSTRVDRLAEILRAAEFDVEVTERIRRSIWYKLWGNMTMNPISALTGATADRILDDASVRGFILSAMAEAKEIGARIGCAIDEHGEDRMLVTRQLGAFKTSMLHDVEAGRAIELDPLLTAPVEIARALGIPTPSLDALLGLTRVFAQMRGLYPQGRVQRLSPC